MNSENSKTSKPHILTLKLTSKLHLRIGEKVIPLIYVNKIENRITFKNKSGYSLELSKPETLKLLESTENKITKDKNGENVPHLEITEVVLVHCILSMMIITKIQVFCTLLFRASRFVVYYKFLLQIISFLKHLTQNIMKLSKVHRSK